MLIYAFAIVCFLDNSCSEMHYIEVQSIDECTEVVREIGDEIAEDLERRAAFEAIESFEIVCKAESKIVANR